MQNNYAGIVLASQSPRRLELLKQLYPTVNILTIVSHIDEDKYFDLAADERCRQLAIEKAKAVLSSNTTLCQQHLVIGADTEVVIDNQSLGKPSSEEDAVSMLSALSGRDHQVISAFSVIDADNDAIISEVVSTLVRFKHLDAKTIEHYVNKGESLDKAGAYGIQGQGVCLIDSIDGSYSNVVGLPLERLYDMLNTHFSWCP